MNKKRIKTYSIRKPLLIFLAFLIILFAPQTWLRIKYRDLIHNEVNHIPSRRFAVVFGARVKEDHSLSDITRERVEAAIQLYKFPKVEKLAEKGE